MSYNGSGTFNINSSGQPVVTGTVISSTAFNALTADLATGLSTAITKDGQTTPTNNIPMGGFLMTGLGAGIASTDSATVGQVQSAVGTFLTASGKNTITASVSPVLTAYSAGQMFGFVAANTNTGATTINISSLGAKSIVSQSGALAENDLVSGYFYIIYYDGTNFQLLGVSTTTTSLTITGSGVQLTSTGTGAWKMPVGTTGQRPTGAQGLIRLNSTTGNPEWYDTVGAQWLTFSQTSGYSVNYLIVAGGGGGGTGTNGAQPGGGGGAGGLVASTGSFTTGTAYTITVGSGGAAGTNGANSVISGLAVTAIGGGAGANSGAVGFSGGSGGGGVVNFATGAGTTGQGNAGGVGLSNGAGGGGGSSATGGNATVANGGVGGAGASNSISGSAVTYAGGGGGGGGTTAGAGGAGGGGAGGTTTVGANATANTGGGGGGGGNSGVSAAGGAGGSGIVILAYLGAQRGTGGTVTSSGGYTIHTFTSSSTYNA